MLIQKRGIDIAEKRLDILSKSFFSYLLKQNAGQKILDLGCGSGFVGVTASFLHHKVFLYDIDDQYFLTKKIVFLQKNFNLKIFFEKQDLSNINYKILPNGVDVVYMGSFLHYLKYDDAIKLLTIIKKKMRVGGRVFVSVSGLNSELGVGYENERDIKRRFSYLDSNNRDRFLIQKQVVLYEKKDLVKVFTDIGFKLIEIKETAFGNLKGVFEKL